MEALDRAVRDKKYGFYEKERTIDLLINLTIQAVVVWLFYK